MSHRRARTARAQNILAGLLTVLVAIPAAIVMLGFIARRSESIAVAQDVAEVARARSAAESEKRNAPRPLAPNAPGVVRSYQPGYSNQYGFAQTSRSQPNQLVQAEYPGKTIYSYMTTSAANPVDPKVAGLANELRTIDEDDPKHEAKLKELRTRLELQFDQMHEDQAKRIKETETRLSKLRKLHEQRSDNKDKIVARRIDELLGKADALRWQPGSVPTATSIGPNVRQVIPGGQFPNSQLPTRLSRPTPPAAPNAVAGQAFAVRPPTPVDPAAAPAPRANNNRATTKRYGAVGSSFQPVQPPPPPSSGLAGVPAPPNGRPAGIANAPRVPEVVSSKQKATAARPKADTSVFNPSVAEQTQSVVTRVAQVSGAGESFQEIFELARKTASASTELAAAELELAQLSELRDQGALPKSEVRKVEVRLNKLRQELELNKIQMEALAESYARGAEIAKESFEEAVAIRKLAESRFKSGTVQSDKVSEARIGELRARRLYLDATSLLEQLDKANQILDRPEGDEEEEEVVETEEAEGDAAEGDAASE